MINRTPVLNNKGGEPCGFPPMREGDLCFAHDPEHAEAAAEARRHGGIRRKRENTLAGAYEFDGIESEGALARLLDIAAYDTLALDLSIAKVRALVAIVQTGEKVLKAQELEERVAQLEESLGDRLKEKRR